MKIHTSRDTSIVYIHLFCHATKHHLCPTADCVLPVLWRSTTGFESNDFLEVLKTFWQVRQHSKGILQSINYSIKCNLFTCFVVFSKELSNSLYKYSIYVSCYSDFYYTYCAALIKKRSSVLFQKTNLRYQWDALHSGSNVSYHRKMTQSSKHTSITFQQRLYHVGKCLKYQFFLHQIYLYLGLWTYSKPRQVCVLTIMIKSEEQHVLKQMYFPEWNAKHKYAWKKKQCNLGHT